MPTLGEELTRLRKLRGWSLREVEERMKRAVSNSYLNQLENDNIKEPSPNVLYELAQVYGAPYDGLMRLAGYIAPSSGRKGSGARPSVAFSALELSEDEEKEVLDFVEFLRRKKKARR
jgi:HTH-type transcriptional regulator, competence development regulator